MSGCYKKTPLPPPQPCPTPIGTLDFCSKSLATKIPPRRRAGVSSWTQPASQLKLNFHLFYRTGKSQTGSSESACHPDIQSMFHLTEGGTRQAHMLLVKSNIVPLTVAQQRLTWARSPRTQPALPVRQHWSPQTRRARQSDLLHDQGSGDFLTVQAIKSVAKGWLGSGPGLVRGHFRPRCGWGREEGRTSMIQQGKGVQGLAGLGAGGQDLGLAACQTPPFPAEFHPTREAAMRPRGAVQGLALLGGKLGKMNLPKDILKKFSPIPSLLPQAFRDLNMPHFVILRANQAVHHGFMFLN